MNSNLLTGCYDRVYFENLFYWSFAQQHLLEQLGQFQKNSGRELASRRVLFRLKFYEYYECSGFMSVKYSSFSA